MEIVYSLIFNSEIEAILNVTHILSFYGDGHNAIITGKAMSIYKTDVGKKK